MDKSLLKGNKSIIKLVWEDMEIGICIISLLAMTIITFLSVISRYIFLHSFKWSEEVCRFLVIWITFGGSAYAFKMGTHIGVSALVNIMPPQAKRIIQIFTRVISIAFFILLGYFSLGHTLQQLANNQLTPATRIPVAVPYSAVPIGSALVVLRLVVELIGDLRKAKTTGLEVGEKCQLQ